MNEMKRTLAYVVVAATLFLLASYAKVSSSNPAVFDDQGERFFAGFDDFSLATSLEVWDFDERRHEARPFKVELKDGVWRIPSKDDYPADAADRLAKAAAQVMGLVRTTLRSQGGADQKVAMGVIDPSADRSQPGEGRGRRITLRDARNRVLADLIVGKAVDDQPSHRYVRVPEERRVYSTEVDLDISTRFADWIETDLLGLDVANIASVTVDAYRVDETLLRRGMIQILPGDELALERRDGAWSLEGMDDEQEVAPAAIEGMTGSLKELAIVDVLPRAKARLEQAGFFVTEEGIFSNEGEIRVALTTGVEYVLRFGGPVSAAEGEEGLRRYMVINVGLEERAMRDRSPDAERAASEAVRRLNDRFNDWYYVISSSSFDALRPARDALLRPKGSGDDLDPMEDGPWGHEGHDHEGHDHEGHDHEGHDHEGHDHEGHGGDRGAAGPPAPFPPLAPKDPLDPIGPSGPPGPVDRERGERGEHGHTEHDEGTD